MEGFNKERLLGLTPKGGGVGGSGGKGRIDEEVDVRYFKSGIGLDVREAEELVRIDL